MMYGMESPVHIYTRILDKCIVHIGQGTNMHECTRIDLVMYGIWNLPALEELLVASRAVASCTYTGAGSHVGQPFLSAHVLSFFIYKIQK